MATYTTSTEEVSLIWLFIGSGKLFWENNRCLRIIGTTSRICLAKLLKMSHYTVLHFLKVWLINSAVQQV